MRSSRQCRGHLLGFCSAALQGSQQGLGPNPDLRGHTSRRLGERPDTFTPGHGRGLTLTRGPGDDGAKLVLLDHAESISCLRGPSVLSRSTIPRPERLAGVQRIEEAPRDIESARRWVRTLSVTCAALPWREWHIRNVANRDSVGVSRGRSFVEINEKWMAGTQFSDMDEHDDGVCEACRNGTHRNDSHKTKARDRARNLQQGRAYIVSCFLP
jgi:hypothetical protein